jgi:hypothetical protein
MAKLTAEAVTKLYRDVVVERGKVVASECVVPSGG